jgi:glycerophosphoryl diester phosphodiesterase
MLAHRGLAVDAPENTLLAFLKALALGADYIETDVHASKDGVAVICHDPDLKRVAGRDVRLRDLTVKELKEIDLGEGQTFSTLAEALDAFPDARFNIDIKSADAAGPAASAIIAARAVGRVLIGSFNERRRRSAVNLMPGVATSAAPGLVLVALVGAKLGLRPIVRLALRGIDAVQVPMRTAGFTIVTRRVIDSLHSVGVEIHIWTINEASTMQRLLDLGVDGLVTDRVDVALGLADASN